MKTSAYRLEKFKMTQARQSKSQADKAESSRLPEGDRHWHKRFTQERKLDATVAQSVSMRVCECVWMSIRRLSLWVRVRSFPVSPAALVRIHIQLDYIKLCAANNYSATIYRNTLVFFLFANKKIENHCSTVKVDVQSIFVNSIGTRFWPRKGSHLVQRNSTGFCEPEGE